MTSDSNLELIDFIKRQINIEKEIVTSLNKGLVDIKNPPVKGVLKGISLDSVKHAELYASALSLLTNVSQALTQENLDAQRDACGKAHSVGSGSHRQNRKYFAQDR